MAPGVLIMMIMTVIFIWTSCSSKGKIWGIGFHERLRFITGRFLLAK